MMLVTRCTTESTGLGTRRPNYSLGSFHSAQQSKELLWNAREGRRPHSHGPPHSTLRIRQEAFCEGSLEPLSKAAKSSHLTGWKESSVLKNQNQILRDPKNKNKNKTKKPRWFLWVHPYFFPFPSLHLEVISQPC